MAVTITIRNVPSETRDALAARAELAGQSMQEYLRGLLIDQGLRPDRAEILRRVHALWEEYPDVRPSTDESAAELVRRGREERTLRVLGEDTSDDV